MSAKKHLAPTLLVLLAIAIIGALMVWTGMIAFSPSEEEQASLDQRWEELLTRAAPIPPSPNDELAQLHARLEELGPNRPAPEAESADESPERTQLLEDFLDFVRTKPRDTFGPGDAYPLTCLYDFAFSAESPEAIPLLELLGHTDDLISRGTLSDALFGLNLEVALLEAAVERRVSRDALGTLRRPTPEELSLKFLAGAVALDKFWANDWAEPLPFGLGYVSLGDKDFNRYAIRSAVLAVSESLWPARRDLERMAKLESVREPGGITYILGCLVRSLPPIRDKLHWQLTDGMARSVEMWRDSLVRWDAAVAELNASSEDE